MELTKLLIFYGVILILILGAYLLLKGDSKNPKGVAAIRFGPGKKKKVYLNGMRFSISKIHRSTFVDLTVQRIDVERIETQALRCGDYIKADMIVVFFCRIPYEEDAVLKAYHDLGSACLYDPDNVARNYWERSPEITEYFQPIFSNLLVQAAQEFDFIKLYEERDLFCDRLVELAREIDMAGYILDDVAVDHLEQTSIDFLDPSDEDDRKGIKRIEELIEQAKREMEE